jgi:cell division initiation protein
VKINPMDIERQTFSRRLRGFDRDEVRTYLSLVAEEVAALQKERDTLEQETIHLRAALDDHRQRETILKNTLLTAQRVSEEIRENARKQAQNTLGEAELQADRLLELARARAHEIEKGTLDLKAERQTLRSEVRALIERLTHILELQEESEAGDKLRFFGVRER